MGDIETVKVVNPNDPDGGHMIINRSDFDESKHTLHPDNEGEVGSDAKSDARRHFEHNDELRKLEANRGVAGGPAVNSDGRNPSGTFSEPTPTDIRYPNKDETEFENNHGAFVQKSAAQMREEKGLPDAPGGLSPDAPHVGKGPRGKWYVKHGTARVAGPFETEDEARQALKSDDKPDDEQAVEQDQGEKVQE